MWPHPWSVYVLAGLTFSVWWPAAVEKSCYMPHSTKQTTDAAYEPACDARSVRIAMLWWLLLFVMWSSHNKTKDFNTSVILRPVCDAKTGRLWDKTFHFSSTGHNMSCDCNIALSSLWSPSVVIEMHSASLRLCVTSAYMSWFRAGSTVRLKYGFNGMVYLGSSVFTNLRNPSLLTVFSYLFTNATCYFISSWTVMVKWGSKCFFQSPPGGGLKQMKAN